MDGTPSEIEMLRRSSDVAIGKHWGPHILKTKRFGGACISHPSYFSLVSHGLGHGPTVMSRELVHLPSKVSFFPFGCLFVFLKKSFPIILPLFYLPIRMNSKVLCFRQ